MAETNWTAITTFGQILAEANNQVGGWFWAGINFLITMVIFITLAAGYGWEAALFSAGFVSILISIFLVYLGLQSMLVTGIMVGAILLVYIVIMWSNKYD